MFRKTVILSIICICVLFGMRMSYAHYTDLAESAADIEEDGGCSDLPFSTYVPNIEVTMIEHKLKIVCTCGEEIISDNPYEIKDKYISMHSSNDTYKCIYDVDDKPYAHAIYICSIPDIYSATAIGEDLNSLNNDPKNLTVIILKNQEMLLESIQKCMDIFNMDKPPTLNENNPENLYASSSFSQNYCGYSDHEINYVHTEHIKEYKPNNSMYEPDDARVRSFSNWPQDKVQKPRMLALAGFFYTGNDDLVRCFYCGMGLRCWETHDDPCEEHARISPSCQYLINIKGLEFINDVKKLTDGLNSDIIKRLKDFDMTIYRIKELLREFIRENKDSMFTLESLLDINARLEHREGAHCLINDTDNYIASGSNTLLENTMVRYSKSSDSVNIIDRDYCSSCRLKKACISCCNCGHNVICEECFEKIKVTTQRNF